MPGDSSFKAPLPPSSKETKSNSPRTLKKVLGEILRLPDFFREGFNPLGLKPVDIPSEYLNRNLIDIGSSSGSRYAEIRRLFKPKSYTGVDKSGDAVFFGKVKLLDMKKMDMMSDDLKGDLGVVFGVGITPEIINKVKAGFKNLVFGDYTQTEEQAQKLIEQYAQRLGLQAIIKTTIKKRATLPSGFGYGYEVYFFI